MKLLWKTVASIAFASTVTFAISEKADAVTLGGSLTGSYNVGTTSYHLIDNNRDETFTANPTDKRELMVQIWYPTLATTGTPAPYIENSVARGIAQVNNVPPDQIDNFANAFKLIEPHAFSGATIANNQASYPVLFYSHGFGGWRSDNTSLVEELASQGYVVVGIDHAYDASATTFPDGRTVLYNGGLEAALEEALKTPDPEDDKLVFTQFSTKAVNTRAADAQFVLDELERLNTTDPKGLFNGQFDLSKVGIFGHSLGGATAATAMLLDSRFDAGINMDGSLWGNVVNTGLDRPFMLLHQPTGEELPEDVKTFYENLQNDAYNLTVAGTLHNNFNDVPLLRSIFSAYAPELANILPAVGSIDSQRGAEIIKAYNLAFFDKYLKGKDSPLLNGTSPKYPEVTFDSRGATSVPEPSVLVGLMALVGAGYLFNKNRRFTGSKTTLTTQEMQGNLETQKI